MNATKKWGIATIAITLVLILLLGGLTVLVDPFFHYHAPLESLQYPINNQRYQNDGIVKNFSYDALITGTSLTENFKTSELDALFGVNSIKVCYSGGTNSEVVNNLQRAIAANPDIKYVFYGIDEWHLLTGTVLIEADGEYPTYLYDDDLLNDVEYVLNKEVLCGSTLEVFHYTNSGQKTTSFDDYSSWVYPYGADVVLSSYVQPEKVDTLREFTDSHASQLSENLRSGLLKLALENPDIQFYCFFPPYSILNWYNHTLAGTLAHQVRQFTLATEILLEAENIKLFSFYTDYETITNLDNYRDRVHYSNEINSLILRRMYAGEYLLTRENYEAHWQEVLEHYQNFDYSTIFTAPQTP